MNIPTAHSTESLERFLKHIQNAPVPTQVNRAYLKESGFVSGNDPELRHIFRLLGFLNDDDEPLERWTQYKNNGEETLRQAISERYKDLFKLFPDAPYSQSDTELAVWFRPPITGETKSAVERSIRTFRKLCQLAEFTPGDRVKKSDQSQLPKTTANPYSSLTLPMTPQPILQLPSFKDKEDYIRLFEALKQVFYE